MTVQASSASLNCDPKKNEPGTTSRPGGKVPSMVASPAEVGPRFSNTWVSANRLTGEPCLFPRVATAQIGGLGDNDGRYRRGAVAVQIDLVCGGGRRELVGADRVEGDDSLKADAVVGQHASDVAGDRRPRR